MQVKVRFAPSPTGHLHIGSARTALFNWVYAHHTGGTFLLRIEDTDRKRSSDIYLASLLEDLEWLQICSDQPPIYQSSRIKRHQEVAYQLLSLGKAYKTDISSEGYTIRLKAPKEGNVIFEDVVYGKITTKAELLDDMVLLRSDGSPTYMLAVVVDDYDAGITHIIRGADHISNTPRQINLYEALNWPQPIYAHIPLINSSDGSKLSKRNGSKSIGYYRENGFLAEAIRNYLMRLGWSHGDDELISSSQAIEWFDIQDLNNSPAAFDISKLRNLNSIYIKNLEETQLLDLILPFLMKRYSSIVLENKLKYIKAALETLKTRGSTLLEVAEAAFFYVEDIKYIDSSSIQYFNLDLISCSINILTTLTNWDKKDIETTLSNLAETKNIKTSRIYQAIRVALTGTMNSPSLFAIFEHLGQWETIRKLQFAFNNFKAFSCSKT